MDGGLRFSSFILLEQSRNTAATKGREFSIEKQPIWLPVNRGWLCLLLSEGVDRLQDGLFSAFDMRVSPGLIFRPCQICLRRTAIVSAHWEWHDFRSRGCAMGVSCGIRNSCSDYSGCAGCVSHIYMGKCRLCSQSIANTPYLYIVTGTVRLSGTRASRAVIRADPPAPGCMEGLSTIKAQRLGEDQRILSRQIRARQAEP